MDRSKIAWILRLYQELIPVKLMFDFGGVLVQRRLLIDGKIQEMPRDRYSECPPVSGSLEALSMVVEGFGRENVFLCKGLPDNCTPAEYELITSQLKIWNEKNNLFLTGVLPENVIFSTRKEKAQMCLKRGERWIVLDDRAETCVHYAQYPERISIILVSPWEHEIRSFPEIHAFPFHLAHNPREWVDVIVSIRKNQIHQAFQHW